MKKKLLLVDDDCVLSKVLGDFFKEQGFIVLFAEDGGMALKIFSREMPDLVLLDIDLPVKNGFEVIEDIRKEDVLTPIILMTGSLVDEQSKIRGYELGAIQYLEKPVSPAVLLAQIRFRFNPPVKEAMLRVGSKVFLLRNQTLCVEGTELHLREREALILEALFETPNQLVLRKKLQTLIWGNNSVKNNKMIDNLVHHLKKMLEGFPELEIRNLYSRGYTLRVE
jgi:DNA-binding response OmpR family regulator